ncbi:MAG: urease accessory protein UreD [Proteobacteria bacterium]|nr:urease accessory protein UreD [Pseudomonadota bacterium]
MSWHGQLSLAYARAGSRTRVHDRHDGPLRVLKSLHPEGEAICHSVLVHPPAGIVGGDVLEIDIDVGADAHALVTTPGATRYYRSLGAPAVQSVRAAVASGARLEWLPLETIAYSGCIADNRLRFDLAPGAEMIGWDVLALGLPASGQDYAAGRIGQQIELPGRWLERGITDATDRRLLDGPLGWAGLRVLGCLWFGGDASMADARRDRLLDAAREAIDADALRETAGATSAHAGIVVLRALASRVEPLMRLLTAVRARWRREAWDLDAPLPRVWRT